METECLSPSLLRRCAWYVEKELGLNYPRERWPDLQRGLAAAASANDATTVEAYARGLLAGRPSPKKDQELAQHLTVGETYFFRERKTFQILEKRVLPTLIEQRRNNADRCLRIWSAGCCTGEEPYSIAIILRKVLPDISSWKVAIHGTDINQSFLKKAARGVYGRWSFRDCEERITKEYFTQSREGEFQILPEYKAMVSFSFLNLANDEGFRDRSPETYDLVFCRNVLMYFSPTQAKSVAGRLFTALKIEGYLVAGITEASAVWGNDMAADLRMGSVFYQKPVPQNRSPRGLGVEILSEIVKPALEPTILPAPLRHQTLAQADCETENYYLQGIILQEQGDLSGAHAAFLHAIDSDPGSIPAHFALASVLRQRGAGLEATTYSQRCLTLLEAMALDETLSELGDMTVGRLIEVVRSMVENH